MKLMRSALVQMGSACGDVDRNLATMHGFIDDAAQTACDLICFPEACVTGYSTESATEIALDTDDARLQEMESYAHVRALAISYGFIEQAGEALHITHVVAGKQGRLVYRKTHLGSRERAVFTAGDKLPVAAIDGICMGVQLCWEANIPDITTTYRAQGVELVLMPYASGASGARRRETWERILPARASDNGIYVAACNAIMNAERGGGIAAFDPKGREIASWYEAGDKLITCELSGELPRNGDDSMHDISYFDRRRPELYAK